VVFAAIWHRRLKPALTLKDNLLTWDDDPRGSMRRLVAADVLSAANNAQDAGAAHKRGLTGLLAQPGHEDGYQPGRDFQEDMRRHPRGAAVGPRLPERGAAMG